MKWDMFPPAAALPLPPPQKQLVESLARAGTTPQLLARKCRVILLASAAVPNNAIAQQTCLSRANVVAPRGAFALQGLDGIRQRQKSKRSRRGLRAGLGQEKPDNSV